MYVYIQNNPTEYLLSIHGHKQNVEFYLVIFDKVSYQLEIENERTKHYNMFQSKVPFLLW